MSGPSSEHEDLMALWQGQPKETDPMILENIKAISRRLDRSERGGMIIMAVATAVAFFVVGQAWQKVPDPMIRVMFALYALGVLGCIAMIYRAIPRQRDPTEPGGVFLRRRLEQYLRLASGWNLTALLPLAPWLVSLVVVAVLRPLPPHFFGPQLWLRLLPVAVLVVACVGLLLFDRPRRLRRLRRDLEELNAAMK